MDLWQLLRRMRTEPASRQSAATNRLAGFGFNASLIWRIVVLFSLLAFGVGLLTFLLAAGK